MKFVKIILPILAILIFSYAASQEKSKKASNDFHLDYSNPKIVVQGLIEAAKTKDLKLLYLVYDPFISSRKLSI